MLHHLLQELDDDLGGGADQHLALATLLGIEDAAQAVVQHRDAHHPEAGEETWSELCEASEAQGEPARLALRQSQGVSDSLFPADNLQGGAPGKRMPCDRSAAAAGRRQLAAIPEACLRTL